MSRVPQLLVVGLLAALFAVAPAQDPPRPKRLALLVGVNKYDKPGFDTLDYAERDATELRTVLEAAGYEVKVLLGSAKGADRATRANVEAALDKWVSRAGKDTTLVVALSGHGQEHDGKPYFCPADAVDGKPDSLVPLGSVIAAAEQHAGTRLVLVDACRSESDPTKGRGINRNAAQLKQGTALFLSCSSPQISHEHKDLRHGVFFHYVLEGLRGNLKDAKNSKGEVTIDRLATAVQEAFEEEAPKKYLPANRRQTPQTPNFTAGAVLVSVQQGPKAGEEREFEVADGVKMVFCWVPAGEGQLGSPEAERDAVLKLIGEAKEPDWLAAEAEGVRGKFKTRGFWLGKYEVTQAEWAAVMGGNPSYFDGKKDNKAKGLDTTRFPVETVSWDDCQKFLDKVNARPGVAKVFGKVGRFRLPHEDEWEYAARGGKGNGQPFYWGNSLNGTEANVDGNYPYGAGKGPYLDRPCPVQFLDGGRYEKHPWGMHHMIGNVWEWCDNEYSKDRRVLHGGSWDGSARGCRAAYRSRSAPDFRFFNVGLRVCLPLD